MRVYDALWNRVSDSARNARRLAALAIGLIAAVCCSDLRADGFSVSSLPALQWWANAVDSRLAQNADGTGAVGGGDPVGFISDLSGNGHNAVMGNAVVANGDGFRPHFETNLISGSPGILFDGINDISSLQSPLFNGAPALTIALAIEAANSSPSNQYIFGSSTGVVGFQTYGTPLAGVQLNNGQSLGLRAPLFGYGLNQLVGSDTMLTVIARFQPNGESDLWENGILVSSTPAAASSANASIQSPAIQLLGNLNTSTSATALSASSNGGTRFYFLEGLAATSALSNAQISQLGNYFGQKWPGVQVVAGSPNLYWDKSQNPQRAAATTVNAGHIQGVAIGDNKQFIFHTAMIEEYDRNWQLITNNQAISAGIPLGSSGYHCGDGDYAQGKIFAPLESDLGGAAATIGVYDATKPGLPLIAYKNISSPQHEMSGLAVVPTAGANGIIYVSSFEANAGGDKLWMYDYAGGNVTSAAFGNFLGALQLPASLQGIQGVEWKAPYFYFSSGQNSTLQRVLYQNGALATQAETVWNASTTVQGLGFDGANLLQVLQSGSTSEGAETLTSSKFSTAVAAGFGSWNLSGDGRYGDNVGFDPLIPNGAGATAFFGGGTKNTVTAATVNVTVDGAYTVGSLVFNPTSGTSYALASDGVAGHGLTLDSGNGSGASVAVSGGNHAISANLVLADSGGHTFNIGSGSSLTISGVVSESGGSRGLTLTGGGTLTLASANSYSGGATINAGTLFTAADGGLGSGPLTVNAAAGANSVIVLGGRETVSGLSGEMAPSGAASVNIAAGAALTVNQAANTTFQGTLATAGTFTKSGNGTLELNGPAVMILGGTLHVIDNGRLRLNAATGSAVVFSGTVVQVAGSATLELAGSISALSSNVFPINRAAIVNNSAAASGVLISGTNQQVGGIDGVGNVVVNAGSDLTATHIIQNALIIGGSAETPATVTIAASDTNGNPLVAAASTPPDVRSFAFGGSLSGPSNETSPPLLANAVASSGTLASTIQLTEARFAQVESLMRGQLLLVPEPSAFVMAAIGLLLSAAFFRRGKSPGPLP
jgi:autotransporter-associated beta strand protein